LGCISNINAKLIDTMGFAIVNEYLDHCMTLGWDLWEVTWEIVFAKTERPATKTQKKIHIQLLCNYPLGITTIVQLSF
jgi:hypothetical protein